LLVADANPMFTMADTKAVKEAFSKIPFIVSFSSFMDETAQFADLILPNHVYLERYEDVPVAAGLSKPVLGLAKPVVKPQFDTMHTGDAIIKIAASLGAPVADAIAWENYEACLKETLGDKWDVLCEQVAVVNDEYAPNPWNFETKSGKFEFLANAVKDPQDDNRGVPHYEDLGIETTPGAYTLITFDSMRLSNGYAASTPFMLKTVSDKVLYKKDSVVQINPGTAAKIGLEEGAYAELATAVGKARVKVSLNEGVMPDVIAMPTGLGHTAYDDYMGNGKGVNVNQLIGFVEDPVSGLNAAWGIRANLTKA
jgi:anaerobic selenocysteine-containing dehydrogenase